MKIPLGLQIIHDFLSKKISGKKVEQTDSKMDKKSKFFSKNRKMFQISSNISKENDFEKFSKF